MVLAAITEFDQLGRDAFLKLYGYRPAIGYFLVHGGKRYDSKAIAGVAYRGVNGSPLRPDEFSGGNATVAQVLGDLDAYWCFHATREHQRLYHAPEQQDYDLTA
ncbi:hypothetical protein ABZ260_07145 [Streptosporangium sp. NPDC006013]|uniref:hypothetical protein n=1 Tax=Streptosporangium sp. NPDC006013 TaxID=3155596 RepID=UPI0033B4F13C